MIPRPNGEVIRPLLAKMPVRVSAAPKAEIGASVAHCRGVADDLGLDIMALLAGMEVCDIEAGVVRGMTLCELGGLWDDQGSCGLNRKEKRESER